MAPSIPFHTGRKSWSDMEWHKLYLITEHQTVRGVMDCCRRDDCCDPIDGEWNWSGNELANSKVSFFTFTPGREKVLFDVIHVVNTKSPEASDKSFLYTALEVFCLGESLWCSFLKGTSTSISKLEIFSPSHLVFEYLMTELDYHLPFLFPPSRGRKICHVNWGISMIHLSNFIFKSACRVNRLWDIRGMCFVPWIRDEWRRLWNPSAIHEKLFSFFSFITEINI